jgi:hypothetical protein
MKFNSDFKHDLELGEMAETDFHLMLSEKKIEVKYDRKTKETGNVYIEFESRDKPSGIKTTQADFWTYYIDDDFTITISTKKLKDKMKNLFETNRAKIVSGGDDNTSKGLLIKVQDLVCLN